MTSIPESDGGATQMNGPRYGPLTFFFGAAVVLLLLAWLGSNPAGAAPDEQAHYIKAAGLSQGQLLGPQQRIDRTSQEDTKRYLWNQSLSRSYYLPARLAPPNLAGCFAFAPRVPASCIHGLPSLSEPAGWYSSYAAIYQPTAYLLPSIFIRFASNAFAGVILGRVGTVILTATLLFLGVVAFKPESALSLLGLELAVTPMAVFLSSSLTNSATEVAGGLCFFACLLAVARDRGRSTPLTYAGLALGGLALGASRPTGPVWVLLETVVAGVLLGPTGLGQTCRRLGLPGFAAVGVVVTGLVFDVIWTLAAGRQPGATVVSALGAVPNATAQLPGLLQSEVGVFGWLDTPLPNAAYLVWYALSAGLVIAALVVGNRHERLALILGITLAAAATIAVSAYLYAASDFTAQGRYYLAPAVIVPILAGHIVGRRRLPLAGIWFGLVAAALVGAVQFLAFWDNARRYADGLPSPRLFILHPVSWTPGGGWWPWILLAGAGAFCILLASISAAAPYHRAVEPARWGALGRPISRRA